eukprot:496078-Prymnesium_polylepis.1
MLVTDGRRESGGGDGKNCEHGNFPDRNISGGDATLQSVAAREVGHSPSARLPRTDSYTGYVRNVLGCGALVHCMFSFACAPQPNTLR